MIDDQRFHGTFGGFQFESELFLYGGEDGRQAGWVLRRAAWAGIGGPVELEVVLSCKSGPVEDFGFELAGQQGGDDVQGEAGACEVAAALPGFGSSPSLCSVSFGPFLRTTSRYTGFCRVSRWVFS